MTGLELPLPRQCRWGLRSAGGRACLALLWLCALSLLRPGEDAPAGNQAPPEAATTTVRAPRNVYAVDRSVLTTAFSDRTKSQKIFKERSPAQSNAAASRDNELRPPEADASRRRWALWRQDAQCPQRVHYTRGRRPTALASYPGSGNTWARHLLEAATGLLTGSVYRDMDLHFRGYRGELEPWNAGTTILQKIHEFSPDHIKQFPGGCVLLLRNPYEAALSFHNFMFGGHRGYASVSHYRRKDWDWFLTNQLKTWLETALGWLEARPTTVIHYEDLLQDPLPSLRRVGEFLGLTMEEDRLNCLLKHQHTAFHRQHHHYPANVTIFSPAVRDKYDRAIRHVAGALRRRRLPPAPLQRYPHYAGAPAPNMVAVACGSDPALCDRRVDLLNKQGDYVARKKSKMRNGHLWLDSR